jgi:hypothetical protein
MKIKNFQVFDEMNQKAVNELMTNDLVGATALKVVKVARKLDELLKDINESVKIMREKYTVKDADGKPIHPEENGVVMKDRIKITDPQAFNKELAEILEVENELDIDMISEEEIKGVKISPKNLMLLSWLIKS